MSDGDSEKSESGRPYYKWVIGILAALVPVVGASFTIINYQNEQANIRISIDEVDLLRIEPVEHLDLSELIQSVNELETEFTAVSGWALIDLTSELTDVGLSSELDVAAQEQLVRRLFRETGDELEGLADPRYASGEINALQEDLDDLALRIDTIDADSDARAFTSELESTASALEERYYDVSGATLLDLISDVQVVNAGLDSDAFDPDAVRSTLLESVSQAKTELGGEEPNDEDLRQSSMLMSRFVDIESRLDEELQPESSIWETKLNVEVTLANESRMPNDIYPYALMKIYKPSAGQTSQDVWFDIRGGDDVSKLEALSVDTLMLESRALDSNSAANILDAFARAYPFFIYIRDLHENIWVAEGKLEKGNIKTAERKLIDRSDEHFKQAVKSVGRFEFF